MKFGIQTIDMSKLIAPSSSTTACSSVLMVIVAQVPSICADRRPGELEASLLHEHSTAEGYAVWHGDFHIGLEYAGMSTGHTTVTEAIAGHGSTSHGRPIKI